MLESCLRQLCHVSRPPASCICCVYASAADSGTTGTHRVFPYLAEVALRAGTFLLPLKSFGPSHSNPESSKPRAWSTTVPLGTWRHYLWTGLCTLQRQSERAALPGGTMGGREGDLPWDVVESSLEVHRDLPHEAGRTPRSQRPHTQLAGVRTALRRDFNPKNLPPVRGCPARSPQEPEAGRGSHPCPYRGRGASCLRAPWAFVQCILPCVLEIMTALGRTKSNKFSFQVPP